MPPLTSKKSDGDGSIQKDVEFVAKDADDQVATGVVMVPDKVDLQNDFVREDQIREFAEQFENFEEVGEAGGGIMHAVFPDEWLDLQRNEVLDEAETIGGQEAPAGAWVQSWKYNNDDLWQLVEDGTFSGYSVGIDAVRWDGPYEQDDVDDVDVPEEIDEEELVWQIVEGIMREVSTVDIPAVPDAMILDKAETAKRLGDHLGNRDAFIEEAMGRGHDEAAAEQMWDVLNDAAEIEGAGQPGKESVFERIGKAVFEALPRAGGRDPPAKAAADDEAGDGDEEDDEDEEEEEEDVENAAGGDTPETDDDTTMSDNDPDGEKKSLAEKNAEQIDDLTETVDEIHRAITGEEKTTEVEIDGETVEVPESDLKSALGVETEAGEDASAEERIKALEARVDSLAKEGGGSNQVRAAAGGDGDEDDDSALSQIGKALS